MKINKEKIDIITGYLFGMLAISGGFFIIFAGAIGVQTGNGVHNFEGIERLYGALPILIGIFFIWGFRIKHKEYLKNKKNN